MADLASTRDGVRADVSRNRRRILDVSADVLATSPNASMQDIADAVGLNRVTLYRHFPSREALLDAMRVAVGNDVKELYIGLPTSGPVLDALVAMMRPLVGLGSRYRVLMASQSWIADDLEAELEVGSALFAAIARGIEIGEIDPSYDVHVVALLYTNAIVNIVLAESTQLLSAESAWIQFTQALVKAVATHPEQHLETR